MKSVVGGVRRWDTGVLAGHDDGGPGCSSQLAVDLPACSQSPGSQLANGPALLAGPGQLTAVARTGSSQLVYS